MLKNSDWANLSQPIGLLGGSFDPVQNAHIEIAKTALNLGYVKSVVFIPAKQNPLKSNSPVATIKDRIEMLCIALSDIDNSFVSDIEASLPVPSYTYDTICNIQTFINTRSQILFLGGTDLLEHLHKWYKIHDILNLISGFLVFSRDISAIQAVNKLTDHFTQEEVLLFKPIDIDAKFKEISASEFRKMQHSDKNIQSFVPKRVLDFALQNKIYSNKL